MSNQGSSDQVSLQADVGNIPNNTVAVLGALSPFIQAVSADNVSPLAVVQVEALGACFHLNGELAGKIPDLLRRTTSYRLERLSHYVGWRGNDTASHMAKTSGGRAASVILLAVTELYSEKSAGDLLYQLSQKILPAETNQSSKTQLGQVAGTLSKKLAALGFGNHLADHVTRVRQAYFDSGIEVPRDLLVLPTLETMTDFLHSLSRALQEEHSMLYFQGCKGVGYMLAIAMALCPDDVLVTVENEVIFQGQRRSAIFDIQAASTTQFSIESILYAGGKRTETHLVSVQLSQKLIHRPLRLKWDGCLAASLDLTLGTIGARFTSAVRISCVDLISAIIGSVSGTDLCAKRASHSPLPYNGFRGLLGPNGMSRVRETLKCIFHCEPSFEIVQCDKAYDDLCVSLADAVPSTACKCGDCFEAGRFTNAWMHRKPSGTNPRCKVAGVWYAIDWFVTRGIVASFVTVTGENTWIRLAVDRVSTPRGGVLHNIRTLLAPAEYPHVHKTTRALVATTSATFAGFDVIDLHSAVLDLVSRFRRGEKIIGISSGACSIFPTTVQNPVFDQGLEYILVDGRFYDGHNYYSVFRPADRCSGRRPASNTILETQIPSSLGVHTHLTLSARGDREDLIMRALVQVSTKIISLDFYHQHLAYMGVNIGTPCGHNTQNPLSHSSIPVVSTSVLAPALVWTREETLSKIAMVLTHRNPEAQFLACHLNTRTLFQGDSCLDCAVKEAYKFGCGLVIQS